MSLNFAGSDSNYLTRATSYISATDPRPVTYSFWFNPSSTAASWIWQNNAGNSPRLGLAVRAGNTLSVFNNTTGYIDSSAFSMPINMWHHFAVSLNVGGAIRFYFNGRAVGTGSDSLAGGDTTSTGYWGRLGASGLGGFQLNGLLAEWAVFRRVLTAGDVSRLARGVSPRSISNLYAYSPMRTHGGTYVKDEVRGDPLTVNGTLLTGSHPPVRTPAPRRAARRAAAGTTVIPSTASVVTTKYAPTVLTPRVCIPTTASLTLMTYAPPIGTGVIPTTRALTLTTYAPTVQTPRVCIPTTRALTLTTYAPTVLTPRTVTPTTAALVLTGYAPTVLTPRTAIPTTAALTTTTYAPTVRTALIVFPGVASLTLTGYAPTIVNPRTVTPSTAALTVTGYAPTVSVASAQAGGGHAGRGYWRRHHDAGSGGAGTLSSRRRQDDDPAPRRSPTILPVALLALALDDYEL